MADEGEPVVERVRVWFDRARDEVCFADRVDELAKEDGSVSDEHVVRIPLQANLDFVDAAFNALLKVGGEGATKAFYGIQKLLDQRAAHAVELAERMRLEMSKRSGGSVDRNANEALVRLDVLTRLRGLRDAVAEQALLADAGKATEAEAFLAVWDHFTSRRLTDA